MRVIQLLILFALMNIALQAQEEKPFPCGTAPVKDPWLSEFQQRLPTLSKRSDTLIFVPVSIHNVGKDDGTGFFRMSALLDAFCRLNQDFSQTNIQFYIKDTIIYHSRSDWHDHASVVDGAFMMFEANIPGTLNCYIVANPAGNCGYNLPYAGIALNTGCTGPNDHTWAHEVGHAFSLPHPFLGWEGDVYDYRNPTPDRVTYDYTYFKDSLILDTTIIDTALVEFVERKNCLIAGDGFCDTPPDYLSRRWQCNGGDGSSLELQKDPDNVDFRSDGTLFMSYANDACSGRFSNDQMAAMEANIREKKSYLIDGIEPLSGLQGVAPEQIFPADGTSVSTTDTYFSWSEVTNATGYVLQASRFQDFRFIQEELVTTDPAGVVNGLRSGIRYYWRVRAFNNYDGCTPYSDTRNFTASDMTAANNLTLLSSLTVFPNPLSQGQILHANFNNLSDHNSVMVMCSDVVGKVFFTATLPITNGYNNLDINLGATAPKGWVFVTMLINNRPQSFKIFVE